MELNFLGKGGSDNQLQGNTSAYFIEKKTLFLIDCGENIFERILKKELLNDIDKVNVFITHTHSDHVGSIGSLIFHCYFKLKIEVNFIISKDSLYLNDFKTLLKIYGCDSKWYNIIDPKELDGKYSSFDTVRYLKTKHVIYIPSYGILFNTINGYIYYSGDTSELNNVIELLKSNKSIDKIYIDTTTTNIDVNDDLKCVHLYIGILKDKIEPSLRNKFYCMHFNKPECIEIAKEYGFNVVETDD